MYRMFVHLQMLKCGGGAHHPGSVDSLPEGSIAVECPACPHPNRNVHPTALNQE